MNKEEKDEHFCLHVYNEIKRNRTHIRSFIQQIDFYNMNEKQVIRVFTLLKEDNDDQFLEEVIVRTLDEFKILHSYKTVDQNFYLVYELVKLHEKFMKEFLLKKQMNKTFLHTLFESNAEHPDASMMKILEWCHVTYGTETLIELLSDTDIDGFNVVHSIHRYHKLSFMEKFWDWIKKEDLYQQIKAPLTAQNKHGENLPQIMFNYNTQDKRAIPTVLSAANSGMNDDTLLERLMCVTNKTGDNALTMVVADSPQIFYEIVKMEEIDEKLMATMFFSMGSKNMRVMDRMCKSVHIFKRVITQILLSHGEQMLRNIFLNADDMGNSVLTLIALHENSDQAKFIAFMEWCNEEFTGKFFQELLYKQNNDKMSMEDEIEIFDFDKNLATLNCIWRYQKHSLKNDANNETLVEVLEAWVKNHGQEELQAFVLSKKPYRMKILSVLRKCKNELDLQKSLNVLFKHFDRVTAWEILFVENKFEAPIFHGVVTNVGNSGTIMEFLEWLQDQFGDLYLIKILNNSFLERVRHLKDSKLSQKVRQFINQLEHY